jgi:hypothetical protein
VWSAVLDGRRLTFRLAGINNQNFVMRDEQTGTWWQQVSGEAIHGPLQGRRLDPMPHDQLTFSTWKTEQPSGRVLQPDPDLEAGDEYAAPDWEERVGRLPVRVNAGTAGPLEPRELIVGITINGSSRAWPHESVVASGVTVTELGSVPIMLVVADDGRSIRAFERRVGARELEFVRAGAGDAARLLDLETLSEWNFQGIATDGPLAGSTLGRVELLIDYWFDWRTYHPDTEVLRPWTPPAKRPSPPIPDPESLTPGP